VIFNYLPGYTIVPALCEVQITCDSVTDQPVATIPTTAEPTNALPTKMECPEFVDKKIKWNLTSDDHLNQVVPPGTYEYEY